MGKHDSLYLAFQCTLALQDDDTICPFLPPRLRVLLSQEQAKVIGLWADAAAITDRGTSPMIVDDPECITLTWFRRAKPRSSEAHGRGGEGDRDLEFRWEDVGVDGGKGGGLVNGKDQDFDCKPGLRHVVRGITAMDLGGHFESAKS